MNIQEKIKELKEELANLEELASKQYLIFYPKGECYFVDVFEETGHCQGDIEEYLKHGRYRFTKKGANSALKLQTEMMRLHALAEDLKGSKDFIRGEKNYYLWKSKSWKYDFCTTLYEPGVVYMTKKCAKKIAHMLNDGAYSLEV